MEVHVDRTIEKPFGALEAVLARGPAGWLPGPREDGGPTAELDVRLGSSRIARRVEVRAGTLTD